jgi:hypothetical protein
MTILGGYGRISDKYSLHIMADQMPQHLRDDAAYRMPTVWLTPTAVSHLQVCSYWSLAIESAGRIRELGHCRR